MTNATALSEPPSSMHSANIQNPSDRQSKSSGFGATASPSSSVQSNKLPSAQVTKLGFQLGKYREIIIAVGFFLLFDLGVLILNFYISFQISQDATAINLAGRQRMLSQRTTKAIYAVEDQLKNTGVAGEDGKELENAIRLFDSSLKAFKDGGSVPGGDGKPVQLKAVTSAAAQEAIAKTEDIWRPFSEKASNLLGIAPSAELIKDAVNYARTQNTQLLARMNEMTTALEQEAADRASRLRLVQTVGIGLALLNFIFILFKFIRSLRRADEVAEAVAQENRQILASVREGLFLINPDLTVGTQIAQASHALFNRPVHPGENMLGILQPMVSNKVLDEAKDYLDLLFTPHVKEQLVQSINPLNDIQVSTVNRLGKPIQKHLSFAFNRTIEDGKVTHLLATVQDITTHKELQAALEEQKQGSQKEFSMMLKALEADAGQLAEFVTRAEHDMLDVNAQLQKLSASSSSHESQKIIQTLFRQMHSFKGEAQSLGLDVLSIEAHTLEDLLQQMRSAETPSQESLLQLPIHLESLLSKLSLFKDIASRRVAHQPPASDAVSFELPFESSQGQSFAKAPASIADSFGAQLTMLSSDVARDVGKSVEVSIELMPLNQLPAHQQQALKDICIQLVRNAVVHGIEAPSQRVAAGKTVAGKIKVVLSAQDQSYLLSVQDDGNGISANSIRQRLHQLGWFTAKQLQSMDDKQLLMQIFRPGFSTASEQDAVSLHAGRGVGLDLVQALAKTLKAQIGLSTTAGRSTDIRLKFKLS